MRLLLKIWNGQVFQTVNIDLQSARETSFDGISRIFIFLGKWYEKRLWKIGSKMVQVRFRSKIAYFAEKLLKAHDELHSRQGQAEISQL